MEHDLHVISESGTDELRGLKDATPWLQAVVHESGRQVMATLKSVMSGVDESQGE